MSHFKRYYKTAAVTVGFLLTLSGYRDLLARDFVSAAVSLAVAMVPFVPIFRTGGIGRNRRLAISISVLCAIGFTAFQGFLFAAFLLTGGFEGPHGAGAPGAAMVAMVFFALIFLCPWILTALRGVRLWNLPPTEHG